jgi:hypothetical protein
MAGTAERRRVNPQEQAQHMRRGLYLLLPAATTIPHAVGTGASVCCVIINAVNVSRPVKNYAGNKNCPDIFIMI